MGRVARRTSALCLFPFRAAATDSRSPSPPRSTSSPPRAEDASRDENAGRGLGEGRGGAASPSDAARDDDDGDGDGDGDGDDCWWARDVSRRGGAGVASAAAALRARLERDDAEDDDGARDADEGERARARRAGRSGIKNANARAVAGAGDDDGGGGVERVHAALADVVRAAATERDAVTRMEIVCGGVLSLCDALVSAEDAAAADAGGGGGDPPLGSHLVRRLARADGLDAHVQDQCSYAYDDAVRTVDHFVDGRRQRVWGSAKVAAAPTCALVGSTLVIDLPPPPPPPPDDPPRADGDAVREGCYIELGGAGGHPDFLRRVRGVDVDADADADADAGGGPVATDEVYAFNLPSVRVGGFLKGKFPRASLRGRVTVTCEKTATEATIDFRRRRVGGCVRRGGEARSLLLGASGGNAYASTVSSSNTTADDDADGGGCREEVKVRAIKTASTARRGGGGGGGVSIARGLRNPRAMTCARLWHAIADATHGARLGALGDSARARVVRPLAPPAAVVQRGEGCGLLGQLSERPSDGGEENGGGDENGGGGRRRRMMRYETALLLTTAAPADAAPPLPRHWSPMKAPARRPR